MITKHQLVPSAESLLLQRDIARDWQALKDENVAGVDRAVGEGTTTLQGYEGLDLPDDVPVADDAPVAADGLIAVAVAGAGLVQQGLSEIVPPVLAVPSLTAAASVAREAARATFDGRGLALANDEEEDTAVEANLAAIAAGEIWTETATAPGVEAGLSQDWARVEAHAADIVLGEPGPVSPARAFAATVPARAATGVEIPPPVGAAILSDRDAPRGLRVSIGRVTAGLLVTFLVGFVVGGWWLETHGRALFSSAAAAAARPSPPPAPAPRVSAAPVVEAIPPAPAQEAPAPAAVPPLGEPGPAPASSSAASAGAEAPRARPAAHRPRAQARNVIKLDELDLTIADPPPSP